MSLVPDSNTSSLFTKADQAADLKSSITKFNGNNTEILDQFISAIETIAKLQKLSDEETAELAHTHMNGRASAWYSIIKNEPEDKTARSWSRMKTDMLTKFKKISVSSYTSWRPGQSLEFLENETYPEYYARMTRTIISHPEFIEAMKSPTTTGNGVILRNAVRDLTRNMILDKFPNDLQKALSDVDHRKGLFHFCSKMTEKVEQLNLSPAIDAITPQGATTTSYMSRNPQTMNPNKQQYRRNPNNTDQERSTFTPRRRPTYQTKRGTPGRLSNHQFYCNKCRKWGSHSTSRCFRTYNKGISEIDTEVQDDNSNNDTKDFQ
eukprot:TRINITY_DN256_c2_g1_i1.p1 TRINITY_DN256_c2_g1~~TRINITY_DN256_c2_g1_i1.p1  ORF type:complete len:321 (+),score=-6.07 TRINITY_DN256_c2_g1_i1:537-1499(+)